MDGLIGNATGFLPTMVTMRAAAALAGAGAWDATPLLIDVAGFHKATFYLAYTRGGVGGAYDFQILVSPYSQVTAGVENWFTVSLYAAGILAAGTDVQGRVQREFVTYASTAAGAEDIVYGPIAIDGVQRIQVRARESGAVPTPGNLHIYAVFGQ